MKIKCLNKNEDIVVRKKGDEIYIAPESKYSKSVFTEYEFNISNKIDELKNCIASCFLMKKTFKIELKEGFIEIKYKKDKAFKGVERIIVSFYIELPSNSMETEYLLKSTSIEKQICRELWKFLNNISKGGY